jgi:hypothetical protein
VYCAVLHCSTLPPGINPFAVNDSNNNNNNIEIQRVWNVKTRVIPVIIGVTGTMSKPFTKYLSTM